MPAGSKPKAITVAPEVPATADRSAVADMLFYPLLPAESERSLVAGVRRVQTNATNRGTSVGLGVSNRGPNVGLAVEDALRAQIGDAIKSVDRTAVLATGGLDSAVVAALVKDVTGVPPVLIAIRAGLSSPEEIRLQEILAHNLEAPLVTLDHLPRFHLDSLFRLNDGSDFPAGGVFSHVWDAAAEAAADRGIEIVFTGDGGNEVFSPGMASAFDLFRLGRWGQALAVAGRSRDSENTGMLRGLGHAVRNTTLPRSASEGSHYRRWIGDYADDEAAAHRRRRHQVRGLRRAGLTYREIDAHLWLERFELAAARDSTSRVPFRAPIAEIAAPVVAALATEAPFDSNPVRTGCQDKHALRLLGRKYLPLAITEARKIGVADQNSTLLAGADLDEVIARIKPGADWLGLKLDQDFARPTSLPTTEAYGWGRLLTFSVWALNAIA